MKRLIPDIAAFIRKELKNSSIRFVTKIVEVAEKDKNNNPEDVLRKMTERNPALNILKNNLKLEID